MKRYGLFQRGDFVQVINEENYLYQEIGEIRCIKTNGQFSLRLADGQEILVSRLEVAPWLGHEKEKKLFKAHLLQMQALAVEVSDRQWFDELGQILKELDPPS